MRIARWIPETTETHSEYVNIYCFSTVTVVARTRLRATLYVHFLSYFLNTDFSFVPEDEEGGRR